MRQGGRETQTEGGRDRGTEGGREGWWEERSEGGRKKERWWAGHMPDVAWRSKIADQS